jgi:hypothetical protein
MELNRNFGHYMAVIRETYPESAHLEVSTYSDAELGVQLSAFNLAITIGDSHGTVESAYQESKVFRDGETLRRLSSGLHAREAKAKSKEFAAEAKLEGFDWGGHNWPASESLSVYNLIYWQALGANRRLFELAVSFEVFSDFAFNKNALGYVAGRSYATQASSLAEAVGAAREGISLEKLSARLLERRSSMPDTLF